MRLGSVMLSGWSGMILLLLIVSLGSGQPPPGGGKGKGKGGPKGPPSEEEEIFKEGKKAFEPLWMREQKILKELRKAYQAPSPRQEEKIFKELRKAYQPTDQQAAHILMELRRAYQAPSPQQEEAIIRAIRQAPPIPEGMLAPAVLVDKADGLFRKLDHNADGLLTSGEIPEALRATQTRWDVNRDGFINLEEYRAYFAGRAQQVLVESGGPQSPGTGKGYVPYDRVPPDGEDERKPIVYRAGRLPAGLPEWYERFDRDGDGQVGLYEWKDSGQPIADFQQFDRNDDGFIVVQELLFRLAQLRDSGGGMAAAPGRSSGAAPSRAGFSIMPGRDDAKGKGPRPGKKPKGDKPEKPKKGGPGAG